MTIYSLTGYFFTITYVYGMVTVYDATTQMWMTTTNWQLHKEDDNLKDDWELMVKGMFFCTFINFFFTN